MTVSVSTWSFGDLLHLSNIMSILEGAEPSEDQPSSRPAAEQTAPATITETKVVTDNYDPASSDQDDSVDKPSKKRTKTDEVRFYDWHAVHKPKLTRRVRLSFLHRMIPQS